MTTTPDSARPPEHSGDTLTESIDILTQFGRMADGKDEWPEAEGGCATFPKLSLVRRARDLAKRLAAPPVVAPARNDADCPVCEGSGLEDGRALCATCGATGKVAPPREAEGVSEAMKQAALDVLGRGDTVWDGAVALRIGDAIAAALRARDEATTNFVRVGNDPMPPMGTLTTSARPGDPMVTYAPAGEGATPPEPAREALAAILTAAASDWPAIVRTAEMEASDWSGRWRLQQGDAQAILRLNAAIQAARIVEAR